MKLLTALLLPLLSIATANGQAPTADQVRQFIAKSITDLHIPPTPVGAIDNRFVQTGSDSIAIRIYRPATTSVTPSRPLPIIYHVHGGAWVAGDLDTHDNICRLLCHDAQAVVVAVHYRRPPEFPYPASVDDVMTVLSWIQANRKNLSPTGPLILLGDSAGGNFVASTCLKNAESTQPVPIAAQVLINPALDVRPGSVTFKNYEIFIEWGLPDIKKANDPHASPLLSNQLNKMPPTSIVVGEIDEIREDGVLMHQKLQAAGVKSTLFDQPKAGHFGGYWCAGHQSAKPALDFVLQQIKAVR
ncbi:alpha/beta hydrolase [Spirosoma linguale]|uniref:Alpha/beta hydrolase fold-3 domain protein n=1 Tax=Spirosoma linguale (strain ATCC 33905 / DSM 74 / LMG 10896 / Claus 1) TaxID=504472 RepID=D2QIR8_SPILD|nr:Alpha/beta hydrolase fold-3 domain protein [Spirosoma linguale DSM 74]